MMPMRVNTGQGSSAGAGVNGFTSAPHISPPNSRGGDDSNESGADGRQRKRLQKAQPQQSRQMTRSSGSVSYGPRSPKKPLRNERSNLSTRSTADSDGSRTSHYRNPTSSSLNRALLQPPSSSSNMSTASNVTTFYAFGHQTQDSDVSGSFDFTPSVNLEDVHRSIVEPDLQQDQLTESDTSSIAPATVQKPKGPRASTGTVRQTSILRRPSISKYGQQADNAASPSRPRRQSSIVPIRTAANGAESPVKQHPRRRPSLASTASSATPPLPTKEYTVGSGFTRNPNPQLADKGLTAARAGKAKSLQPPPRDGVDELSVTPDHTRSLSFAAPKSPKSPRLRLSTKITTPGSNRRISTIPHASGLGARTISPTDARRLKRLSTINTPPPVPRHSTSSRNTPLSTSPSLIPRKSATPSSSGTTPEPLRKSYSSGLSTNSTNTSARTSTASLQHRLSQTLGVSRLPQVKPPRPPQNEEEEDIPPVPPLPKGLVPAGEGQEQVASSASSAHTVTPGNSSKTPRASATHRGSTESSVSIKIDGETRRKRGMTLGHTLETKQSANSLNKKNLAPLRLPPLNLLPLSTPTIARVNALGAASDSEDVTPPRRRGGFKTPSTPLTASKSSFFGGKNKDDATPPGQRSTSSMNLANASRNSPSGSFRAGSSSSSNIPVSAGSRGRQAASPYISSSLPKSADYATGPDVKSAKILGLPIPRAARRPQEEPTEDVPDTPASTTSIRRKLSLSWKRSSSKSSHAATERESEYQGPKYENMPPPKLPLSATWQPGQSSPSPIKAVQERRRKSSITGLAHDRTKSESWSTTSSPKKDDTEEHNLPAKSSTSSLLSPMHKILSSKSSYGHMKRQAPSPAELMDQEDRLAEQEMIKIASKRKNLDQLAIELEKLKERAHPKEKLTPPQAMRTVGLNIFERGEIVDYKDVYFCGTKEAKKHIGDLNSSGHNFGYDDERGDYAIVPGDHLAYRYEIIDVLGKGSFGQVVRCIDHKTGGLVAIKIIRNKKRFHQQALVEVNILQKLREWDPQNKHSLVNFTQSFYFRGHLCISTELLGMNLYEFIKSNDFRGFSLRLIRTFTKQMLSSLLLLKGHRVIHCDLKPENILLAHPMKTDIKVIDFGSSCFENEKVYTYIQSRFYRSPEVILGMTYGLPIDMWSLGCILAELYTGYPIFPGENEQEQLACIMEVFGPPEKHLIEKSTRKKLFFDSFNKPRGFVSAKGRRRKPSSKSLRQALKCDDEAFLDFIARCLRWDPDKRMKPDEAIHHPFITGMRMQPPPRSRGSESASSRFMSKNYISGSSISRPLPDPPSASSSTVSSNIKGKERAIVPPSASPIKNSMPPPSYSSSVGKRQSAVGVGANSLGNNIGIKRTSNGSAIAGNSSTSSLPRVAPRSGGGSGGAGTSGLMGPPPAKMATPTL